MLKKIFAARSKTTGPSVPPGERVYAVGDIHGCVVELDDLLGQIERDDAARGPADTTIVFLGDFVDRGPSSAQVIDRLLALRQRRPNTRFLIGNHEELFIDALAGEDKPLRLFTRVGGRETVLSYGMTPTAYDEADYDVLLAEMQARVPATHRVFLESLENMVVKGDYAFVHAGIHPDTALEDQRPRDLRWIREPFLSHRKPLEKLIVHGHTIVETATPGPVRFPIDTGAYLTGVLTALGLEGDRHWLLQTAPRG
ncbi:metallophosphoesterase family protein [Sphingomonas sp. KR1UV-12]|uniref:Metallophosphoesterase family protein n=1 Tax=Sphingomonas aurea TaxID=3063994 RepID=A0ABT9EIK6_9SPHN|nr:metallophosphoesterase family protein [Sphingomonas sp. KR1UV-12]MDP1026675.1 metallophosphoesterase family protein [Sphingomonas sp. KR1UV-12]